MIGTITRVVLPAGMRELLIDERQGELVTPPDVFDSPRPAAKDSVQCCQLDGCDVELRKPQRDFCSELHRDRDKKRRRRRARLEPVPRKPLARELPAEYTKSCVLVQLQKSGHEPILRRQGDADRVYDRVRPGEGRFPNERYAIAGSHDISTIIRIVEIVESADDIEPAGSLRGA